MNETKLNHFVGEVIRDLGGAFGLPLIRIGGELGLYRILDGQGPKTSAELAASAELNERYVREWLCYHAASGYVIFDGESGKFELPEEHAAVLAREDSPAYMLNAFDAAAAYLGNQGPVQQAFRTGGGVDWGEQTGCLFCAVAGFFRPGYQANLVDEWLPSLEGVVEKLDRGALVADVGCGHGHSSILMAEAFPNSTFVGFDFHEPSIHAAREHARTHGLADNLSFRVADAKSYEGHRYDLVTFFDCLHDMGDPIGVAAHVRTSLRPDGTWMVVEPLANDELSDNLNPVSRLYYAASTMVCLPASLAQEVGVALGAQAGEARLTEVIRQGGFAHARCAAKTAFNLILEAKPV